MNAGARNVRAFESSERTGASTVRGKKTTSGATHSRSTPAYAFIASGRHRSVSRTDAQVGKMFTIHLNDVGVCSPSKRRERLPNDIVRFRSERDLARLAASWPALRLVEIWNRLPGSKPVRKFTDRTKAVRRIWKAIQSLPAASKRQPARGRPKSHRPDERPRGASQKTTVHQRTKTDQIVALLQQPSGATLQAIMAATEWQAHSVRGFISGQLRNRMGLRVKSFERNGERVYAIQD